MQLVSLFITAVILVIGVVSRLHYRTICLTYDPVFMRRMVHDVNVTREACAAYKARNTGSEPWESCPDCEFLEDNLIPFCSSLEKHIGGDEWEGYCQARGASRGWPGWDDVE
ncbi:hypothetical protein HYFRA_00013764 [Hymenoscyphus fraxineus]|uniref:Uncharacterized protein n=1 Tax=Hymenoscyphus fraxineus TaxID=746836 RepID=A0A9N9LB71_9HELO|nr:hypothetical protein HYFRA_00013764 [Hymenoscyphus fraxineus]